MSAEGADIVFYQSAICPRCQLSKLALRKALKKFPQLTVARVEFLTSLDRARRDGVRSIPALVADGRCLSGVVLTASRIERFFESLTLAPDG